MTDYCLFTIEHQYAKAVYLRGIMDITQPIDDFDKIIRYGNEMSREIPSNPFKKGEKEFKLYEQMVKTFKDNFEDICHELVFAKTIEEQDLRWDNRYTIGNIVVEYEKVII